MLPGSFEGVHAILFVVNLNAYNQVLFEDSTKNRMMESLELFKSVVHNPLFFVTPIVLVLNKKDLFEQEIARVDVSAVLGAHFDPLFPECKAGHDVLRGIDFFTKLFEKQMPVCGTSTCVCVSFIM